MKEISSHHYGGNDSNLVMKDENNRIIAVFEDKSSVLGNKVAVYDDDGNIVYFLDEDMSQEYDAFNIQKDSEIIANVRREDTLVHRQITVKSKGNDYDFSFLQRILHKNGEKIAKLVINNKDNSFKIELYAEEDPVFLTTLLYTISMLILV